MRTLSLALLVLTLLPACETKAVSVVPVIAPDAAKAAPQDAAKAAPQDAPLVSTK